MTLAPGGTRRQPFQPAVGDRDVHEQVHGVRDVGRVDAVLGERGRQVLGAGGVPPVDAERGVALGVARGDQHVVHAGRVVGFEAQERASAVRDEGLADGGEQPTGGGAGVGGAQVLGGVVGDEREQVADLAALDVDDAQALSRAHSHGAPFPRGHLDRDVGLHARHDTNGPRRRRVELSSVLARCAVGLHNGEREVEVDAVVGRGEVASRMELLDPSRADCGAC